ncbi:MAG TPA: PIN domain-containing protein [Solirubrobacterales bacterium]
MGAKGNGESSQRAVVLDTGALIAFERAERRMAALFEEVIEEGEDLLIPTSVLAQVWRGGPRSARLARLIAGTVSDALDEARAREVGERLGNCDKADIADAHVVCCAVECDAELLTSDPDDIKALTEPGERLTVVAI